MTASLSCAAGATWVRVTEHAAWEVRSAHTSVIDATGAIYVLGGNTGRAAGFKDLNDVWRSTDGGEARHATGASSVMIGLRGEWS
jgi:hypothetical protein